MSEGPTCASAGLSCDDGTRGKRTGEIAVPSDGAENADVAPTVEAVNSSALEGAVEILPARRAAAGGAAAPAAVTLAGGTGNME